jgi:hypothetical protein
MTAYARLQASTDVAPDEKNRLTRQMAKLDPVLMLKQVREGQEALMAISQNRSPENPTEISPFIKSLATAWKSGEVRPTYRREPKPGRWRRTRQDPFEEVWPMLLSWLEEQPDLEAKTMLNRLRASGQGEFPESQLRTLQRRIPAEPASVSSGASIVVMPAPHRRITRPVIFLSGRLGNSSE